MLGFRIPGFGVRDEVAAFGAFVAAIVGAEVIAAVGAQAKETLVSAVAKGGKEVHAHRERGKYQAIPERHAGLSEGPRAGIGKTEEGVGKGYEMNAANGFGLCGRKKFNDRNSENNVGHPRLNAPAGVGLCAPLQATTLTKRFEFEKRGGQVDS